MKLKVLYTYLLKAYLPPFILTLFIGVFVFFLIHVFTYMDEIVGKGMGFWTLSQFFFYSFLTFIPIAMPLAVLLSSIMTFGNLAENYELAAIKSCGVSLFGILKPLIFFILFLAGVTFIFNNYALPAIALKSHRMLWDIRQAKPTLNIKQGVFYDQLEPYTIKIGTKSRDGEKLFDISIYDHTDGVGNNIQLYADSGMMKTSTDTNYLQIHLFNGSRYEDIADEEKHKTTRPLMQMYYKQLNINVDMSSFKKKNTDDVLFKGHHEMMNIWEINSEIDTFNVDINKKYVQLNKQFSDYFLARTLHGAITYTHQNLSIKTFYNSLKPEEFKNSVENAKNLAKNSDSFIESIVNEVESKEILKLGYSVAWHNKITVSFACIILFFVGVPLGAIIKKGGMGLPVVVAVICFLLYYIVTIIYKDLIMEGVYSVVFGSWFPLFLFLPLSIFLTYKAARDSAIFDLHEYLEFFKKLFVSKK